MISHMQWQANRNIYREVYRIIVDCSAFKYKRHFLSDPQVEKREKS